MFTSPSQPTASLARPAGVLGLVHVALLVAGLAISGGGALLEDGAAGDPGGLRGREPDHDPRGLVRGVRGLCAAGSRDRLPEPLPGALLRGRQVVGPVGHGPGGCLCRDHVGCGVPGRCCRSLWSAERARRRRRRGAELDAGLRVPAEPALPWRVRRLRRALGSGRRLLAPVHRRVWGWSPAHAWSRLGRWPRWRCRTSRRCSTSCGGWACASSCSARVPPTSPSRSPSQ